MRWGARGFHTLTLPRRVPSRPLTTSTEKPIPRGDLMKAWLTVTRVLAALTVFATTSEGFPRDEERIRPWREDPRYWQYKGRPILLVGGSKDDNLFQLPDLREHLDELRRVGGNYIRNTMSDRPDKGFEVYPFGKIEAGPHRDKFDLGRWNPEYWSRFERFLRLTEEREIIVQIELWDRFDYSDNRNSGRWSRHPYNPENNVNYTSEESRLRTTYTKHPGANEQPFFYTVPSLQNNHTLLRFQIAQIDKLLSYSLDHGNVLYCIDNETSGSEEWGKFWALHLRKRAAEKGVEIHITEMWDQWNPRGKEHRRTFDHPELYSFIDISQNNHNKGQKHWDNLQWVRAYAATTPRPINTVKIYGADTGRFGDGRDGEERFWRNLLGGLASTRFHRRASGLGLGEHARSHIRSFRLLASEFDFLRATPDVASEQLTGRTENEAYLTRSGSQCAVYFPKGGAVGLRVTGAGGELEVRWLEIARCRWRSPSVVAAADLLPLEAPGPGHWVALVTRVNS